MKLLVHLLLVLATVLAWTLPVPGGEGGENAGGTGIWILPRCSGMHTGSAGLPPGPPRLCGPVRDVSRDIDLQVSEEMGQSVAVLLDDGSGLPQSLPVSGQTIRIPAAMLTALAGARLGADVIVLDAANNGYRMRIVCDEEQGSLSLAVY